MKAKVVVMPKKDVLDPQGKAVGGALHSLGHSEVEDIRVGKIVVLELSDELSMEAAAERVTAMCDTLLANPVIEEYTFELEN